MGEAFLCDSLVDCLSLLPGASIPNKECRLRFRSLERSSSVPFPVVPQPQMGEAFLCDPLAVFLNLIPGGVQSWEPWDGLGTHGRTIPLGGSRRLPSLVPKYNQWLLSYVSCHVENTNNNHIHIVRMKCAS